MFEFFISLLVTSVATVVAFVSVQRFTEPNTGRLNRKGLLGLYCSVAGCLAFCGVCVVTGATTALVFPACVSVLLVVGHLSKLLSYCTTIKPGGDQKERLHQLLSEPLSRTQRREAERELRRFRNQLVSQNARMASARAKGVAQK